MPQEADEVVHEVLLHDLALVPLRDRCRSRPRTPYPSVGSPCHRLWSSGRSSCRGNGRSSRSSRPRRGTPCTAGCRVAGREMSSRTRSTRWCDPRSPPSARAVPGQRTITSGLCRARKTSTSCAFHASSSVCINSAFRSSVLVDIAPPRTVRTDRPYAITVALGYQAEGVSRPDFGLGPRGPRSLEEAPRRTTRNQPSRKSLMGSELI